MFRFYTTHCLMILALVGCSLKQNMDQVRDDTRDIKDATGRVEGMTSNVADHTRDVYLDGRKAGSIKELRDNFAKLREGGQESVVQKIEYGTVYFASQEFQYWKGRLEDDTERRLLLFAKAVDLFFAQIDDLIDESFPVSVLNIFSQGFHNWLDLSVLSMAMDKIEDDQLVLARERGFRPISMLNLIEEGLKYRKASLAGEQIPLYANRVLQREQQAIYLLQLRQNFYPLLVLGLMTDFDEGLLNMGEKILSFKKLGLGWTLDLRFANQEQIRMWRDFLRSAEETREFLQQIGRSAQLNPVVQQAFQNIKTVRLPKVSELSLEREREEFLALLTRVCSVQVVRNLSPQ